MPIYRATNSRATGTTGHVKSRLLVLAWLVCAVVSNDADDLKCPKECKCYRFYAPEYGPSVRVECLEGNMHSLPVNRMEYVIHQLVIAPPLDKPNFLTIGPILTQPRPFSSLRDLIITNSNVPSIGQHSFWGLPNLKTLNLTLNNLTSIFQDNFRGLVNLTSLSLMHNSIEQMPSETFGHLTNLRRLILAHNQITSLNPRQFRMLAKLTLLDLSFNPLNELNPESFKDIQQLTVFRCRRCFLRRVNGQIYHLASRIEELDLGENLFKYLTVDEFINLKRLKRLQLDGNQISVVVDSVFGQNRELRSLELAHNRIALLAPGSLTNLSQLSNLDISYNRIEKFQLQAFAPVVNSLRSIDLSGNNLSLNEVAVILQILPHVNEIGLANLSLMDIPPNFFVYNERLESLDISSNRLITFPYNLLRKSRFLRTLDISNNKLVTLSETDLHRLEAIPNINLSNNAWHCEQCLVGAMFAYMKTTVLNETLRNLRCRAPQRLIGMRLADLSLDLLDPCSTSHEAQMSVVASFVLVLIAVLAVAAVTLCCTRRRTARYYTDEEKRLQHQRDHPEELLTFSERGSVATIQAPFQHETNNS